MSRKFRITFDTHWSQWELSAITTKYVFGNTEEEARVFCEALYSNDSKYFQILHVTEVRR